MSLRAKLLDPAAVLSRRDLVTLARACLLVGGCDVRRMPQLIGRRFSADIPLSCGNRLMPARATAAEWSVDPTTGTLELTALLRIWARAKGQSATSISGFWINRPIQHSDCTEASMAGPEPPNGRVGLAATAQLTRNALPNGWSSYTAKMPLADVDIAQRVPELRFFVEGRVTTFPNGASVECGDTGWQADCRVAVKIDRLGFRRMGTKKPIAEWNSAS